MPIEHINENSVCDKCGKDGVTTTPIDSFATESSLWSVGNGKINLCSECIEKDKKAKERKCEYCKENVWTKGGVRKYDKKYCCKECLDKFVKRDDKRKERIHFLKSNWKFWIGISVNVILALLAIMWIK